MAEATSPSHSGPATAGLRTHNQENVGLLSADADFDDIEEFQQANENDARRDDAAVAAKFDLPPPRRIHVPPLSTIMANTAPGQRTPRTPNRVRFDLNPTILHGRTPEDTTTTNGHTREGRGRRFGGFVRDDSSDDDGYDSDLEMEMREQGSAHRTPLLTDIEAPSVALANSPWGDEDVHDWAEQERARPKSDLKAAFMNMANSIIGAGIIGQPYAFKQAGLLAGIILLVGLTIVVDWTICLIVVNSKLSGANSFQGTVEHCFGKTGLIAISLAQWLFAFGGMVAFGVIVGDSIPHVMSAIYPGLSEVPVLGLLADRKAVIVIFILGVSFPLTLYRDIAKVRGAPSYLKRAKRLERTMTDFTRSLQKRVHWR